MFEAVARCLGRLAAGSGFRPVLVVLDDLHWADEPSLRLLGFLARALAAESVALLGAYRDTEASPELLKIAGQAQQLALAGLTPDDIGRAGQGPGRDGGFRLRSPPSCGSAAAATRSSSGS